MHISIGYNLLKIEREYFSNSLLISTRFSARQLLGLGLNLCRQARGSDFSLVLARLPAGCSTRLRCTSSHILGLSQLSECLISHYLCLLLRLRSENAEKSANFALVGELLAAHEQHVLCEEKTSHHWLESRLKNEV